MVVAAFGPCSRQGTCGSLSHATVGAFSDTRKPSAEPELESRSPAAVMALKKVTAEREKTNAHAQDTEADYKEKNPLWFQDLGSFPDENPQVTH